MINGLITLMQEIQMTYKVWNIKLIAIELKDATASWVITETLFGTTLQSEYPYKGFINGL